jgi:CheY-like chemotaxis protein
MNKTILLVDDSATSRMKSRMLFGDKAHYQFISACDGQEGLEMALERKPDLILMDVEMPRMNGIETCQALRKNASTRRIPIILLTMRSEESIVKQGIDSGCTEYMVKPVNEEKLAVVVKKYLG